VAALTSRIVAAAPQVHILATSREALQAEGEHVYKLDPLACPPEDPGLTAAVAQTFPAIQLFMDRAVASGARIDFSDAEARIVAGICRKLDGVALAIELAARRVEAHGLAQIAALLDQRLMLLRLALRTAPPRQKTLQATLDWSYGLLSEPERTVLCRLAVFVGHFTLDAALAVVTSADVDQSIVFDAIDSLVAKSMIATDPIGAMMRYRLLDTTRAYALGISVEDAEQHELGIRHATYYWSRTGQSGRPYRATRNARPVLQLSTTSARLWNGALAKTATLKSASNLRLLPRPFFWRGPCLRNAIVGRSEQFSLSTMPCAGGPRRCILKRPWEHRLLLCVEKWTRRARL
jgi:predicted ATPase